MQSDGAGVPEILAKARRGGYDLVVLDAFGSSSVPFHLVTEEAFGLVHSRLNEGGILAMNVEAVGWHDIIVHSLAATLGGQFAHVKVLPMEEPPDTFGNVGYPCEPESPAAYNVDAAGPSTPVQVLGLSEVAVAGDEFVVASPDLTRTEARALAQRLSEKIRLRGRLERHRFRPLRQGGVTRCEGYVRDGRQESVGGSG